MQHAGATRWLVAVDALRRSLWSMEGLVGFLAALYLMVGRWSPSRLVGSTDNILAQPRLWIVLLLFGLSLLPYFRRSDRTSPRVRPAWTQALLTFLFAGYMIVTIAWAPDWEMGVKKGTELLLIAVLTVAFTTLLTTLDARVILEAFWRGMLVLAGVNAFAMLAFGLSDYLSPARKTALGGGPNVFGRMMGMLCLISLVYVLRKQRVWLWLPVSALAILLVVLSGSRGALLASAVGILALLCLERVRFSRLAAMFALVVALSIPLLYLTPMGNIARQVYTTRVLQLTFGQGYSAGRDDIYALAVETGLKHPFFGIGLAGFAATNAEGFYPHNLFLEIFSEGGIIGLFLIVLVLLASCKLFWDARRHLDTTALACFILLLTATQLSGDLYDSRAIFFFPLLATIPVIRRAVAGAPAPTMSEPSRVPPHGEGVSCNATPT